MLYVEVNDDDSMKTDDLVDVFAIAIERSTAIGQAMPPILYYGTYGIAQMELNFSINCADGFYGPSCEVFCLGGVDCRDCLPGFTGTYCHMVDHCFNVDCGNGVCINEAESFICVCNEGYTGDVCDAVDFCPCVHGNCTNTTDSFHCSCATGFTGEWCNSTDHCSFNNCTENQICVNTEDSFLCQCETGDKSCGGERNSCSCPEYQACVKGSLNSYVCVCDKGMTGLNCTTSISTSSKSKTDLSKNVTETQHFQFTLK